MKFPTITRAQWEEVTDPWQRSFFCPLSSHRARGILNKLGCKAPLPAYAKEQLVGFMEDNNNRVMVGNVQGDYAVYEEIPY